MQMETKFLRLRTPVELGSRFGDWEVCWLGGWARFRLHYLVMVVKVPLPGETTSLATGAPPVALAQKRALATEAANFLSLSSEGSTFG
jgi:hypothetical protein